MEYLYDKILKTERKHLEHSYVDFWACSLADCFEKFLSLYIYVIIFWGYAIFKNLSIDNFCIMIAVLQILLLILIFQNHVGNMHTKHLELHLYAVCVFFFYE